MAMSLELDEVLDKKATLIIRLETLGQEISNDKISIGECEEAIRVIDHPPTNDPELKLQRECDLCIYVENIASMKRDIAERKKSSYLMERELEECQQREDELNQAIANERNYAPNQEEEDPPSLRYLARHHTELVQKIMIEFLPVQDYARFCSVCQPIKLCLDNEFIYKYYTSKFYPQSVMKYNSYRNQSWKELLHDRNRRNIVYISFYEHIRIIQRREKTAPFRIYQDYEVGEIVDFMNRRYCKIRACAGQVNLHNQFGEIGTLEGDEFTDFAKASLSPTHSQMSPSQPPYDAPDLHQWRYIACPHVFSKFAVFKEQRYRKEWVMMPRHMLDENPQSVARYEQAILIDEE